MDWKLEEELKSSSAKLWVAEEGIATKMLHIVLDVAKRQQSHRKHLLHWVKAVGDLALIFLCSICQTA